MAWSSTFRCCALALGLAGSAFAQSPPTAAKITVTSSAFSPGGKIPDHFTCKGADVNPTLQFGAVPAATKSLVLIVDDPDAPGGLFTHWLVWNIAPTTMRIGEKAVPPRAIEGTTDFGKVGYGGPCPPSGTHRYYFRVFALDRTLDLKTGVKRAALEKAFAGHVIARGELMARFSH